MQRPPLASLGLRQRWKSYVGRSRRRTLLGILVMLAFLALARPLIAKAQVPTKSALQKSVEFEDEIGDMESNRSELDVASDILSGALEKVEALQVVVDGNELIPKFAEKAADILDHVSKNAAPEFVSAVDGALHVLFLKQLSLLRQQLFIKFEKSSRPLEAMKQADKEFVAMADSLRVPGSIWSYLLEQSALRSSLEGSFRRDAALAEERAVSARTQQATISVIGKLQTQMEQLQQKVQGVSPGRPWVLSTSYRIPNTPLQVSARYQQGRANVELNLSPDRDPVNSENGFVEGFGPANIGLSFNVGV